jgi:multidrug efflux pump subunit AcrB
MAILPILPSLSISTNAMDSFVNMAQAMLVAIDLAYLTIVIMVRSLPMLLVIFFALPLVVTGAFVVLAVTGHATNIITGSAVSLQAAALPLTVIAAGM